MKKKRMRLEDILVELDRLEDIAKPLLAAVCKDSKLQPLEKDIDRINFAILYAKDMIGRERLIGQFVGKKNTRRA